MDELFNQLKSEGSLKKRQSCPKALSPPKNKYSKFVEEFDDKHQPKSVGIRRGSMPSPTTVSNVMKKSKRQKTRSLSPPKYGINNVPKLFKVKLERKKIEEFLTSPLAEHVNNQSIDQAKVKNTIKQKSKMTPTKAQQKQFEPSARQEKSKEHVHTEFNIRPCKVRIRRDNLKKLGKDFNKKYVVKKHIKSKDNKRSAPESFSESPPSKKGKISDSKSKNSFFIKLNTSPPSKKEKKIKNLSKSSYLSSNSSLSSSSVAMHNKIKNSKFKTITTPTKLSRSQLIRSFGKRVFNVEVKIERCSHPLMLTFESNDRARRLQSKRDNKSKNLSVSFREQVEIFGGSSDSDDSCDEDFCAIPNRNKNISTHSKQLPKTPVIMPARLKKIENGKVVNDIELDPSLFVDPKNLVSSTPFSPGRKKRDHKSFSPLKDENSPSPRKEQLKLANEKIPPSGLRRLNIDEEDDEDDDCEYIVPIELPQRRNSRSSPITSMPLTDPADDFAEIFENIDFTRTITTMCKNVDSTENAAKNDKQEETPAPTYVNNENGSDDSFKSANSNLNAKTDNTNNQYLSLRVSPTGSTIDEKLKQTNGNGYNESKKKHINKINSVDETSVNIFLEDSQTSEGDTHAKSYVDSLINETIDKLSKDIDENATDKQYNSTT